MDYKCDNAPSNDAPHPTPTITSIYVLHFVYHNNIIINPTQSPTNDPTTEPTENHCICCQ